MSPLHQYTPVDAQTNHSNAGDLEEYPQPVRRIIVIPRINLLAVVAIAIITFIAGDFLHPLQWSLHSTGRVPGEDDETRKLNALVPTFPKVVRQFDFDRTFMGEPGEEDTAAWVSQIPKGKGIVKLPTHKPFPNDTYNLAVYHQLHCLYTLRQSFWAFYRTTSGIRISADKNTTYMLLHGNHCFEYLRQAVSCNMDLTLEPFSMERDTFRVWGVKHRCTDFDRVSEWAVGMRRNDDTGIVR